MDADLRQSMLTYYEERALEYEEAYLLGTGTSSIPDPEVFRAEARMLGDVVGGFAKGRLIDLACGTGFWLRHYVHQCSSVTLFDQSLAMLDECVKKAQMLAVTERCSFVQGDFFGSQFERHGYDTALVGFFLSHLTEVQEQYLFDSLHSMLAPSGRILVLDSAWSAERARFNAKVGRQRRRLNDGTEFDIYKRYCDAQDISGWEERYGVRLALEHFGAAFFAVRGEFI